VLLYRDTSITISGDAIRAELSAALARPELLMGLLVAADMECALTDMNAPAERCVGLTDDLAEAWLTSRPEPLDRARAQLPTLVLPDRLKRRVPEGYAYYALDPASFVELARAQAGRSRRRTLVLGVRSIGVSLSAVVCTELLRLGVAARRITVRPTGHPWQRQLVWSRREASQLLPFLENGDFLVVDEGPGLSGSTFLAVGEALLEQGVPAARITFLCSHPPDSRRLVAPDAERRWARFSCHAARTWSAPERALDVSGGLWREQCFASDREWPACWPQLERVKYLTEQRDRIVKFSGFGGSGAAVKRRAQILADAGWSPRVGEADPGFLAYAWSKGRRASASLDRERVLPELARYLALRSRALAVSSADVTAVQEMARINVRETLALDLPPQFRLDLVHPVEPDGRLLPHEWITDETRWVKTDSADHAADHLLPGAVDVAWDLAGAVVEWQLDGAQTGAFLRAYRLLSGDDVSARLPSYVVAYTSFRLAYASYAGQGTAAAERERWALLDRGYRDRLRAALHALAA
jgi:hypothetical protein